MVNRKLESGLQVVNYTVGEGGFTKIYEAAPDAIEAIITSDSPLRVSFVRNATGNQRARALLTAATLLPLTPGIFVHENEEGLSILKHGLQEQALRELITR